MRSTHELLVHTSSAPHLRAWLLGTFQVERRSEDGHRIPLAKSAWEKHYTRQLFSRLLCSRNRRAQRGMLLDDLWPDPQRPDLVERYLSDAYYHLRTLFRPLEVVKSLHKGQVYELVEQSLLWCDADACEAFLQEAEQVGRTSAPAVPLLEQAQHYFARGAFLEQESGQWAHARRGTMERLSYRCSLWLAEAYEQQGQIGQAEMQYSRLLEENPTDEQVLCRLLTVLHKQGMASQVQQCYQQAKLRFQQEGIELSTSTKTFVQNLLRTEYSEQVSKFGQNLSTQMFLGRQIEDIGVFFSSEDSYSTYLLSPGNTFMKEERRHLLQQIMSFVGGTTLLPQVLLDMMLLEQLPEEQISSIQIDNTILIQLEIVTKSYWRLFIHAPSKSELLSSVLGHLRTIVGFIKNNCREQIRAHLFSLASESAQIAGEIFFDMHDYGNAQSYYRFSAYIAKEAKNNALLAVALGRLSFLPIYRNQPQQAYPLIQRAKRLLTPISRPMLNSWISVIEAEIMAHLRDEISCEKALERATTNYNQISSEEDKLWTRLNDATIPGYKGACYIQLRKTQKAFASLEETLTSIPEYSLRHQSLILTDIAATMVQMNELEEACKLLQESLRLTGQTKSLMVLTRMQSVRKDLNSWNNTPSVKDLDMTFNELTQKILP